MESDISRAGDREDISKEDRLEKILDLVMGLDWKINDIYDNMTSIDGWPNYLEEDDMSTVAFRSVNETVISEDNSKEEKLNLLAEGFVLPERSNKYRYDKGVDKLVDQIVVNMNKLWPSVNKNYYYY